MDTTHNQDVEDKGPPHHGGRGFSRGDFYQQQHHKNGYYNQQPQQQNNDSLSNYSLDISYNDSTISGLPTLFPRNNQRNNGYNNNGYNNNTQLCQQRW